MLASAPLFPKFVAECVATYHELRKRGTRALDRLPGSLSTCAGCHRSGDPLTRPDRLTAAMAPFAAPSLPRPAFAQAAYPDRPVRLIVPFPPGGAFDTVGRPWADRIKPHLGTVIIENIGGAGGGVGAAQAARSRPDGYTLLLGGATTHITEALLKTKPTFDPLKDLEPISPIAVTAFAIAVHPSVSANNLKELVAYVKANPGKMSYGSAG